MDGRRQSDGFGQARLSIPQGRVRAVAVLGLDMDDKRYLTQTQPEPLTL
jgi:hypothetical protein